MTVLAPMCPEHFERFRSEVVASYAQDNVVALRWKESGALERSSSEFDRLLPDGLATPEHHLHEIQDGPGGQTVGYLWFMVSASHDERWAFLYNIRVFPEFRGRGHAGAAMKLFERRAIELEAAVIGLHVFAFNSTAQALYRSLGYGISGFNMLKRLPPSGA